MNKAISLSSPPERGWGEVIPRQEFAADYIDFHGLRKKTCCHELRIFTNYIYRQ